MNSQGDFVPRVEHNWTRPQHMEENASWRTAPPATVIFFNAHSGPLGGSWPVLLCCLHSPDSCKILTCLARDSLYSVCPLCFPTIPLILILVHNLSLLAKPSPQNRSRRETWSQKYPYQGWPMQCRKTLHTGKEPQILYCCFSVLPPS